MAFISKIVFHPLPGKTSVALQRIQRLGEITQRAGARARIARVVWGDGAGRIHYYGVYTSMEACAKATAAAYADPAMAELMAETEKDPVASWDGPEIWRSVFGEPQPNFPLMMQRDYEIDRRQLKSALALLPEVQATQGDNPVLAVVPAMSGDMTRLMIGYYATSLIDVGQRVDSLGTSEAFQSILVRAAEWGRLTKSRLVMNV